MIPVHLYGQPADLEAIRGALPEKVLVLEDAAHCVEGSLRGVRPGQASDGAAFSFYATKNLTCGEGGALAMRDPAVAERARRIRQHGMTAAAADRYRGTGEYRHFDVVDLGVKANLPDVLAALLVGQVPRLEAQRARREAVSRRYDEALARCAGWERPAVREKTVHARHLYTVWAPEGRRDEALKAFSARGIGVAVNWRALPDLTWVRSALRADPERFPVACSIGRRTISIPLWVDLPPAAADEVAEALVGVARDLRA